MTESPSNKKPIGIVLIVVYTTLNALNSLLSGIQFMPHMRSPLLAFISLLLTAIGVLCSATAYGLWTFQNWGYNLAKILYIILIPLGVASIFTDISIGHVLFQITGIAVSVWILVYLFKPETKSLFVEV